MLKLHQAGARSVVALMGSVLYPAQRSALQLFPRVILMLDGDTAGQRGSVAATAQLSPRCHVDGAPVRYRDV